MAKRQRRRGVPWLILVILIAGWLHNRRNSSKHEAQPAPTEATAPRVNPLDAELAAAPAVPRQDGIGAAILLDASGSMADEVPDAAGRRRPKIVIARKSVTDLVRRFSDFAAEHPDRVVRVAILEFSHRDRQPAARIVVPAGAPDAAAAERALAKVMPKGGTPIGDAMLEAKRELDRTGLSHRHILVVTDGESNRGYHPADVASALARQTGEA